MENYFLQEISFHHLDWSPVNLICTFIKRREYLSIKPIIKQFVLYLPIVDTCFVHGTYLVPIQSRAGKNHTWYLSILVHYHIISACKNTPTNAQIWDKQQKIAMISHNFALSKLKPYSTQHFLDLLTPRGVADLPPSFFLNSLREWLTKKWA